MRIGLGCTMIEPGITHGQIDGVGFYTQHLWQQLPQLRQTVIPLVFPPIKNWHMTPELPHSLNIGMPYMAATALSLVTPRTISVFPTLEKTIDLFHATDHLVVKLKRTPVAATLHDALILKHPDWFKPGFRRLKNALRVKTMQWADHVIAISESMVQEAIEYWGIPEKKISMVYNGLDASWHEPIPETTRIDVLNKLGLPQHFILVIGTLQPKKNIPRIADAFLSLPNDLQDNYPLVIVGKDGWNSAESLAAIDKLIASKKGYWLRYLSDADVKCLFQIASVHLHPSLHEGFGLTLLQAFASGTPVITSNVTAMPEVAGDAALLVDPWSVDSIRQALVTLLTSPTLRQDLIAKGYARAKEFSWEKCAKETVRVYQAIVNR